jgi:transposase
MGLSEGAAHRPVSGAMAGLIAARDWLTVCRLSSCAHELNPVEGIWSVLKRCLANLAKRDVLAN